MSQKTHYLALALQKRLGELEIQVQAQAEALRLTADRRKKGVSEALEAAGIGPLEEPTDGGNGFDSLSSTDQEELRQ